MLQHEIVTESESLLVDTVKAWGIHSQVLFGAVKYILVCDGRDLQENSFYFSFGPDDLKFNLGYDFVRENLYCTVEVMMDAKGTKVEYDSLEIKQDKKAKCRNTQRCV